MILLLMRRFAPGAGSLLSENKQADEPEGQQGAPAMVMTLAPWASMMIVLPSFTVACKTWEETYAKAETCSRAMLAAPASSSPHPYEQAHQALAARAGASTCLVPQLAAARGQRLPARGVHRARGTAVGWAPVEHCGGTKRRCHKALRWHVITVAESISGCGSLGAATSEHGCEKEGSTGEHEGEKHPTSPPHMCTWALWRRPARSHPAWVGSQLARSWGQGQEHAAQ